MKKIFILMIMLIALPLEVFATKEVAMPLNVSAVKDNEVYNFEIKNAKANDLIEIEVKSEGNEKKATFKKNVLIRNTDSGMNMAARIRLVAGIFPIRLSFANA